MGPGLVVSHKLPGITAAPAGLQTPHGAAKPGGETRFSTPPSKPTGRSFRKGGMLEGVGGKATLRNPNHRGNLLYDARNPKLVLWDNLEGWDGEEGGTGVQEGGDLWDASLSLYIYMPTWSFQVVLGVKNPPANAGDVRDKGSIPGSRRSPGGGHGNPLQYSCLQNPMDGGVWRTTYRIDIPIYPHVPMANS